MSAAKTTSLTSQIANRVETAEKEHRELLACIESLQNRSKEFRLDTQDREALNHALNIIRDSVYSIDSGLNYGPKETR